MNARVDLRRCAPLSWFRRLHIIAPLDTALRALREGVAVDQDVNTLARAVSIGLRMDAEYASLGMAGHFAAAAQALDAIRARASDARAGLPYELHLAEIEVLQTAIDLHQYQLGRIGAHHYALAADSVAPWLQPLPAPAARAIHPQTESLPL